jgi:hypothetical protein
MSADRILRFQTNRRRWLKLGLFSAAATPLLRAKYEDPARQYRFEGFKATAQLKAAVNVPSIDFTFKTDPLETSKADFAVMGNEVNGKYSEEAKG